MKNLKLAILGLALISFTAVNAQEESSKGDEMFTKLDANADAKISKEEFIAVKAERDVKRTEKQKQSLENHTPKDAAAKFAKKDLNSDGFVDRTEFDQALKERAEKVQNRPEGAGPNHFDKMDTDNNGVVNQEEFNVHVKKIMAKREENGKDTKTIDADKKFSKLDGNGDGNIDKVEYETAKQNRQGKSNQKKEVK